MRENTPATTTSRSRPANSRRGCGIATRPCLSGTISAAPAKNVARGLELVLPPLRRLPHPHGHVLELLRRIDEQTAPPPLRHVGACFQLVAVLGREDHPPFCVQGVLVLPEEHPAPSLVVCHHMTGKSRPQSPLRATLCPTSPLVNTQSPHFPPPPPPPPLPHASPERGRKLHHRPQARRAQVRTARAGGTPPPHAELGLGAGRPSAAKQPSLRSEIVVGAHRPPPPSCPHVGRVSERGPVGGLGAARAVRRSQAPAQPETASSACLSTAPCPPTGPASRTHADHGTANDQRASGLFPAGRRRGKKRCCYAGTRSASGR